MIRLDDNIQDDELRVLGKPSPEEPKKKGFKWYYAVAILLILSGVIFAAVRLFDIRRNEIVPDFYETELSDTIAMSETIPVMEKLGNYKDSLKAYTEHIEMTVNDIPLDIYIPHNAKPRLFIGTPDLNDKNVIFTTQAADIRADNGKINGAFVLAGEPKAANSHSSGSGSPSDESPSGRSVVIFISSIYAPPPRISTPEKRSAAPCMDRSPNANTPFT